MIPCQYYSGDWSLMGDETRNRIPLRYNLDMEARQKTSFRPYLFSTLVLSIGGWGGLLLVINITLPTVWPRWGFFALCMLALTGTALPIIYFFHLRFTPAPLVNPHIIMRQAIWVGVYGTTLAWLQLGRVLSLWIIMGLASGLTAIEWLIRVRERSQWIPPSVSESETPLEPEPSPNPPNTSDK